MTSSPDLLRDTFDALSASIAILDADGVILGVNRAWLDFAGENDYETDEGGVGVNYLELCRVAAATGDKDADAVSRGMLAVKQGECEEFRLEYPCHSPQEQRWFLLRVTRFVRLDAVFLVAVHENVTMYKQLEQQLTLAQQRFYEAERIAHFGSWEMEIATGRSVWSDEFFRICGYDPGSVEPSADIGFQIIHPDDRQRARETLEHAIQHRQPYMIEKRIVRPNGEVRHVLSQGNIVCDTDNHPLKLVGSFLDITERKQAEEELLRRNTELQDFNSTLINREMRIIELKEEVDHLAVKLGKEPPYPAIWRNSLQVQGVAR